MTEIGELLTVLPDIALHIIRTVITAQPVISTSNTPQLPFRPQTRPNRSFRPQTRPNRHFDRRRSGEILLIRKAVADICRSWHQDLSATLPMTDFRNNLIVNVVSVIRFCKLGNPNLYLEMTPLAVGVEGLKGLRVEM
jgi:hypothetical protein